MKMHAAEHGRQFRIFHSPAQGVLKESCDDGIAFIQPDLKTGRREQESVLTQPCGGVNGGQGTLSSRSLAAFTRSS